MTGSSFTHCRMAPAEVRLPSFRRPWTVGVLASLIITYHRDGSQALEKKYPGYEASKSLLQLFT